MVNARCGCSRGGADTRLDIYIIVSRVAWYTRETVGEREREKESWCGFCSAGLLLKAKEVKMSSRIYSDGHEIDGSWVLRVFVTDLNVERSLRVKGELHIGGVMLRLVEDLGTYIQY